MRQGVQILNLRAVGIVYDLAVFQERDARNLREGLPLA